MSKTKIELTPEEARLFKRFRQYKGIWERVFDMRNGNVILHLNSKGEIKKKEFHYFEPEKGRNQ